LLIKLEEIEIQEPRGSKNMKFLFCKATIQLGTNNEQNDSKYKFIDHRKEEAKRSCSRCLKDSLGQEYTWN